MSRVGASAATGQILVGWPLVAQSIGVIVSTELRSLVQRRDFGALIPSLIDRPQLPDVLVDFYMAIAEALEPRRAGGSGEWYGEPCFRLARVKLSADTPGVVIIWVGGDYLPDGHLGDFTTTATKELAFPIADLTKIIEYEATEGTP